MTCVVMHGRTAPGMIYQRKRNEATGLNMIPNRAFCKSGPLPKLFSRSAVEKIQEYCEGKCELRRH